MKRGRHSRVGGLVLAAAFPLLSFSNSVAADGERPDVLLITFDTLRASHSSAYGYRRSTTPNLEALADRGVRFEIAYAPSSTTAPSHATLFSGLLPTQHGVRRNGIPLADRIHTLAEHFDAAGYRTAGFVSSKVVGRGSGLGQGFDVFDDEFRGSSGPTSPDHPGTLSRGATRTTNRALRFVRRTREVGPHPIFVWVHYFDPHEPYTPPDSGDAPFSADSEAQGSLAQLKALYDLEIRHADSEMGRLIESFESNARDAGSLIVVTADHGESFLEHGWRGHGAQIYDESVRVPLVFTWDRHLPKGSVVDDPVSLRDVPATLTSLLSLPPIDRNAGGVDLSGVMRGDAPGAPDRPIFLIRREFENPGRLAPGRLDEFGGRVFGEGIYVAGAAYGVRVGRYKYIESPDEPVPRQLFDLARDPGEINNLVDTHPQLAVRLAKRLDELRKAGEATVPTRLPPGERELLEHLGYFEPVAPSAD